MMKLLRGLVESQEKHFEKGAKLEFFYPMYEMVATILFSPTTTSRSRVHVRDALDTKRYMILVVLALIPCTVFGLLNTGYQTQIASGLSTDHLSVIIAGLKSFLPILLVSYAVGGTCEVLFALFRRHEINEGFLVTGLLFPLTLPPTIPLWQVGLGIAFGVVIGKEVFGGTGRNFLNPALTARAFVYFSYPAQMSGEIWTKLSSTVSGAVDGYSMATPLAIAAETPVAQSAAANIQAAGFDLQTLFWGWHPGSIGETSIACILLGAAFLIITGVGSWRIMAAVLLGTVGMAEFLNMVAGPESSAYLSLPPLWHLLTGSVFFAAIFMATDPVSAPDLPISKWIYGLLIGAFTVIIRVLNPAYPEGAMLAVLMMNVFSPLIDHYVVKARLKRRMKHVI